MFHHILSLYDLSKPGRCAMEWAFETAVAGSGSLTALHILPPHGSDQSRTPLKLLELVKKEISADLDELKKEGAPLASVPTNTVVMTGKPFDSILEWMHKKKPDIVFMGTHGRTGWEHFLMGSVAEKMVRHSFVPVFVVKKSFRSKPKRIILPVDITEMMDESLTMAEKLNSIWSFSSIELLYVIPREEKSDDSPRVFAPVVPENRAEQKMFALNLLQKITKSRPSLPLASFVAIGAPAREIIERAKENLADLIIMPTHGRSGLSHIFIGSVAEQVIRYAPCNILSFRPQKTIQNLLGDDNQFMPT